MTLTAPAKINLVLEVLGKREDGYHEIRSVMQTISLCDTLDFTLHREIVMECNEPSLHTADNLVMRAAEMLRAKAGYREGARIALTKRIPLSSGLGGGSSDAAATLIALNRLWRLGLSADELATMAAELGSDIPFFIYGGLALVKGRGEKVIPLPAPSPMWYVLLFPALPPLPSKTRQLYGELTSSCFSNAEHTGKLMEHWSTCGRINTVHMYNIFDFVAAGAYPGLEDYIEQMKQSGAERVHLAGSGPTLVTPVPGCDDAKAFEKTLAARGITACAVHTLGG